MRASRIVSRILLNFSIGRLLIMSNRESGTVKWFNNSKGFGFIGREAGEDVFVHYRAIKGDGYRTLKGGQIVEFTVVQGPKGLQAEEVEVTAES